jgi:hypothetical protein
LDIPFSVVTFDELARAISQRAAHCRDVSIRVLCKLREFCRYRTFRVAASPIAWPHSALIQRLYASQHSSSPRRAAPNGRIRRIEFRVQESKMSFAPSLSLFIGLGIMIGVLSTLLAIVVDRIDARLAQRSCDKALAARRSRKAREAQQTRETREAREAQTEDHRDPTMGFIATKVAD